MSFVDSKMLIMFDTKANSNKFYEAKLDSEGNIYVRYGRVGQPGRRITYLGGQRKFGSLLRSKERKGYKEALLDERGSGEIQLVPKKNVVDIALKQIKYHDEESRNIIKEISRENIHNITATTSIKFDNKSGLFKTPLGIVSKIGVEKALGILDQIETMLPNQDKHENEIFRLNEEYFVIIPNRVENAREKRYLVFDKVNLEAQRKICSSLFDTLELMDDLEKGGKGLEKDAESQEVEKVFDVEIELLDMGELFQSITDHYQKSKNPQHGDRIMKSKIQKIFKVRLANQQDGFAEGIGNVQELWHGTRAANILSIMAKGLLMPSKSPGTKAGAMFGNGLYFANQSSKSLQYCDGLFWANGTSSKKKVYMFMATVALGKYEVPVGPTGDHGRPQKGYDSFWAKAGTSLVKNDEIIVFKGNQVRLDYLLEISFDD